MIVHPNSSLTILSIAEGPDGLLWLATASGVYRFDGFHYDKIAGYPFSSARFIGFTSDGSLWAGDFQGLVRYRGGQFEIVLREEVHSFAAFPGEIYVYLPRRLLRITLDGAVHTLPYVPRRDLNIDPSGRLWSICGNSQPMQVCRSDPRQPEHVDILGAANYQEALGAPDGSIWLADDVEAVSLKNGQISRKLERAPTTANIRPGPLLSGRDGQIWFLGEALLGLTSPVEFRDRADNDRYPPLAGFEDEHRHLWVAALGRGLVEWIPDPQWQSWFPEDLAMEPAVQMARDASGILVLATRKNLYRLKGEQWSPLMKEEHRLDYVLPLDDGSYLASIRDFGVARLSHDGAIAERVPDPLPVPEMYRRLARDARGRLWVASKRALFRIEGRPGSLRLRAEPLPEVRPGEMADPVDFEMDSRGRLWLGFANGIAWLDEHDVWHKIPTDRPVTVVRSLALAGNDEIWLSYRRPGSFSRLRRIGNIWKVETLVYPPADTHFVKRDSRGWLWRGTPNGVYISDGTHIGPDDWIHLGLDSGLAVNETDNYGFFEDVDHTVWIAGAEGATHFKPESWWFGAPANAAPPRITRVEADGQQLAFEAPGVLPAGIKLLQIEVGGMDAPPFRDAPLRYRLLPVSKDWRLSRDGTLEFRDLAAKAYTLEVGYVGASATSSWEFNTGPPTRRISWLWLFVIAAGLSFFVLRIVREDPIWFAKLKFRVAKALFLLRRRGRADTIGDDHSGETLAGRYYLQRIISRGGFSVVYEGLDLSDGNARIAVKVMNRNTGDSGWVRDRFAHEVAALRSIDHAGVVPVLESWVSPAGEPCLAMPFLDGPTLRAAISGPPFARPRAARVIRAMAEALAEVHRHGIVHRDLKPENIVLLDPETNHEQPVILDFGTAGLRSAHDELAATTLMSGSFHYMSPERLTGRYSPASDVFSFAVIILEVLTGKKLAGLKASSYDVEFCDELAATLAARIGPDASHKAAQHLALAFDPEPRRRPADLQIWAGEIAGLVDLPATRSD
jgi:ligand-binding sensor domain-containing protein